MENTEETSANAQEEMELAEEIIGGRKCENTKNQYRRKYEHFRKWIVAKYPECSQNENTVNLASLSKKHLQDFFGHICKKKKNGDYMVPVVYQTFQQVSGYKSAIKDHFTTNECVIKPDDDKMLRNFFGGNQRKIANLKQNGVMSVVEGK